MSTPTDKAPAKLTKIQKTLEERAVHNFENMCDAVKSVSPSFIKVSIEALTRSPQLTARSKKRILAGKLLVEEKMLAHPKIVLPAEWTQLDTLTK